MTKEEHELVFTLFAVQQNSIKIMLDILRSRGIISDDDALAFQAAANFDQQELLETVADAREFYRNIAKGLGALPEDFE